MLTAGDELGRTQGGNNNAYCQDNEVSWLDWSLLDDPGWRSLRDLTARLVRLRRRHPVLRQRAFFSGRAAVPGGQPDLAWFTPQGREMTEADWFTPTAGLGMLLSGTAMSERDQHGHPLRDDSFLLLLNAGEHAVPFTLPGEPRADAYGSVVDTALPDQGGPPDATHPAAGTLTLPARSLHLLRLLPARADGDRPG